MVALLGVLNACGPAATTAPAAPAATVATQATTAPGAVQQPPAGQPKRGGTLTIRWWTGDPPDLDPYLNTSFRSQEFAGFFYSRLLKFDSGPGIKVNSFLPTGDLSDKWTVSTDGLVYTFHIRDNATWQNKAPLNGRKVTADDVVYSWDRFQKVGVQKAVLSMVKQVKAVDASNVAFTLNDVFAPFESTIATPLFWIVPKEIADADGDLRKRTVGSGPFIFDKYDKGVQVVVKRNPDYYFTGQPYVDEVDLLIVPDDATAVAGMRSKQIDINGVSQTDRDSLLKTNPDIQMTDYIQNLLSFIYWRLDAKPFNDVRVRQAVSLALDRDEALKTLYEGRGEYNSHIAAGLPSFWLDPRGPDFGPIAKYFKRDVAAAKQLLADAGYPNGLTVPYISTLNAYGNTFNSAVELVQKELKDAGIILDFKPQDYAAYIASTFLGKFDGGTMVYGLETPVQEPHDYLFNMYSPKSARNHAGVNDPDLVAMIDKETKTLDKAARKQLINDIQRYLAEKQYYVQAPVGQTTVAVQPWVKGFFYESDYGRGAEYVTKLWLDGKPSN
jgi:peptide/nickel transport system substrate-binding protein